MSLTVKKKNMSQIKTPTQSTHSHRSATIRRKRKHTCFSHISLQFQNNCPYNTHVTFLQHTSVRIPHGHKK